MKRHTNIVIYGTHICPWCECARKFMRSRKIPFENVYVDDDKKAEALMIKKSGQHHVPVIQIGEKIVIGFDEDELRKLLKRM